MVTTSRLELVRRRSEQWATALVDLTPRNPLLHFKDTASTLDLTDAAAPGLDRLVTGSAVRLSALIPDPDARTAACRRLRTVRKRVVLAAEEQGIEIGRLARGLLRVEPPAGRGSAPVRALRAPLLLQPLSIGRAKGADGRLSLNFGPINREGGERRLNVAVTRARTRMHVVSAITHEDLPPISRTKGPEVLRRFLPRPRQAGGRATPAESLRSCSTHWRSRCSPS